MATVQGGWAAKNASTFARTRRLRNTTRPDASAPCAWKTRFAISNPIVLACPTDASSSGRSTPPPWHADAVRGRPSHHGPDCRLFLSLLAKERGCAACPKCTGCPRASRSEWRQAHLGLLPGGTYHRRFTRQVFCLAQGHPLA